jgi:hypothetical protein
LTTPASHPISSRDGGSISPQRARGQAEAKAGNARTRSREKAAELAAAKAKLAQLKGMVHRTAGGSTSQGRQ